MIKSDFIEYRDNLFERCRELNKSKGEDYTKGNEDALANFKEGSQLGIPPMKVCAMFTKKHLDAIFNYVRTDGQSESEPFQERIADAINYLTLF